MRFDRNEWIDRGSESRSRQIVRPARFGLLLLAGIGLSLLSRDAAATSSVARGPTIPGVPTSLDAFGLATGPVSLVNGPLWLGYHTYHITNTEAWADDSTGILRGAARMRVTADHVGPQPYSFFTTNATGTAEIEGPPGVPQTLVATFSVHGRFSDLLGRPGISLQSTLVVDTVGGGSGLRTSDLTFERAEGGTALQVHVNGFSGPFPGVFEPDALPTVSSLALDDLRGTARIVFEILPGNTLFLEANVIGTVGPEGSATDALASTGAVDFLDTGILRLELPPGVSLVAAEGALASPEVVVPEPSMGILLPLGSAFVAAIARGARRRGGFGGRRGSHPERRAWAGRDA